MTEDQPPRDAVQKRLWFALVVFAILLVGVAILIQLLRSPGPPEESASLEASFASPETPTTAL